ncbi:MAG TPA: class I SAM-dependent methyltransferase [Burkholderiaceae bacterium]
MSDWKSRLYNAYVSTGQAGDVLHPADLVNPYHQKVVAPLLPARRDVAVLDLACGNGRLLYNLRACGYTRLTGVDISPEQVAVAHRLGLTEVQCADLAPWVRSQPAASFDVVCLMDILEHLDKPEVLALLDEVHRILRPGGLLIAHVPNGAGLFGMRVRYGDFTHEQAFTPQSMQQILRACRFEGIACMEDRPVVHGAKSLVRAILWQLLTLPLRLLLAAETGVTRHVLSQNLLARAAKSQG